MKTNLFAGILPCFFLLAFAQAASGQCVKTLSVQAPDTGEFFLYVQYCGSRYNREARRQEFVIKAVKLPGAVMKKMPRLKGEGLYTSRNRRIYAKQQKILSSCTRMEMIVPVNKNMFRSFYPKGLNRGAVIEDDEFFRWDFIEKPVLPPQFKEKPAEPEWWRNFRRTDPVNIRYGLIKLA
jgi:hypothetical protein